MTGDRQDEGIEPRAGRTYEVELCSGERRRWRCLGEAHGVRHWRDEETGLEFGEGSLMYAWTVVGEAH